MEKTPLEIAEPKKKYETEYMKLMKGLVKGGQQIDQIILRKKLFKFSDKQSDFISKIVVGNEGQDKFILFSGGRGCGKSLALCMKIYLICKGFPGIRVLLGRKNISDIEKTTLQDLFRLMQPMEYEHRVKDNLINFKNGSQIVLMGLDAMQSGNVGDMKKAQQKTKSLNIGAYFIDQLEEIEYDVFQALNDTMRMVSPEMSDLLATLDPVERYKVQQMSNRDVLEKYGILDYPRQGNMTTNPANFWAYHYFKTNQRRDEDGNWIPKAAKDTLLIEGSMLDNKDNLPADFVRDRLSREDSYVRRMVHGEWNLDVLVKGSVFAKEHIRALEGTVRAPIRIAEGCEIFEEPRNIEYRMGIDPSEGVVDPSSISIISEEGKKVAKWNGMIPTQGLADKAKFLYYMYRKPLTIIESNTGAALIRELRDLRLYKRKVIDERWDRDTEKLGVRMTWEFKSQLIDHFQALLRRGTPKIYDRKTIEEMKTFLWTDEATQQGAGAARGFHDDDIMSTLLAYWEFNPKKMSELKRVKARPVHHKRFQYG